MEPTQASFTIYPAIDLRRGRVVRLLQGDPTKQTIYSEDAAQTALRWLRLGAAWLHIVNLDAAMDGSQVENAQAIEKIIQTARERFPSAGIQYGGGLRSLNDINNAFTAGASRVILGTAAVRQPDLARQALVIHGPERICLAFDAREGFLQVHGWTEQTDRLAVDLGQEFQACGLRHAIYTDISRDGGKKGINLGETLSFANKTGLSVIASGGVASLEDVLQIKKAGLSGVILGRALYDGTVKLDEALAC